MRQSPCIDNELLMLWLLDKTINMSKGPVLLSVCPMKLENASGQTEYNNKMKKLGIKLIKTNYERSLLPLQQGVRVQGHTLSRPHAQMESGCCHLLPRVEVTEDAQPEPAQLDNQQSHSQFHLQGHELSNLKPNSTDDYQGNI